MNPPVEFFLCIIVLYYLLTVPSELSVWVLAIAALCIILVRKTPGREAYGGPIKNVRKIPMNDCYAICDAKADFCNIHKPMNAGLCETVRSGCKSVCKYSNAHRL